MSFDDRYLAQLTAESDGLEAAALHALPAAIAELAELREARVGLDKHSIDGFTDSRRRLIVQLRLAACAQGGDLEAGIAARLLGALAPPAFAGRGSSLQAAVILTASTLEGVAVAAHQAILAAPSTASDATLRGFARACIAHHERHRVALDAQLVAVGGSARDGARPAYLASGVTRSARKVDASDLVAQAAVVERLAAQTYRSDLATLPEGATQDFLAAIADVATHNVSGLRALGSLGGHELVGRRAPSPAGAALLQLPVAGMARAV